MMNNHVCELLLPLLPPLLSWPPRPLLLLYRLEDENTGNPIPPPLKKNPLSSCLCSLHGHLNKKNKKNETKQIKRKTIPQNNRVVVEMGDSA